MAETTDIEGVTQAFNRQAVQERSRGEPAWLAERRAHAWEVYESLPMPTRKREEWRYTDLRRLLALDDMTLGSVEPLPDDPSSYPPLLARTMDEDHEAAGHLVVVDGAVVHTDIRDDLAALGVILMPLQEAVRKHPELVEPHLAVEAVPAEASKFAALNAALWSDGIFVHVPRGVRIDKPIRVTRWISEEGAAFFSRTLIVAESTSQLSYVDEILSDDFAAQTLASAAVEVIARDGAQVQYVSLQRMGRGVFYQSEQSTLAGRDATLDSLNVTLGASVSRVDLGARLMGSGSSSNMMGLYFGDGKQHFDHNTSQDHQAPSARSDLLYKGALDDRSRAAFRGIIRVRPGAQQTDAYQTNRNLLLSDRARADSLPNLEIEADDVKCSHGSTVGQLDQEHLFYLMSRGLSRERAERLVVLGFLGEVLSRLPLGGVVEKVTRAIEQKLHS